jgi:Tfp pilus assembly protein PilP
MRYGLLMILALAACGDDEETPTPRPGGAAAPAAAAAAAVDKSKLQPRMHVEDRIRCPIPEKPDGPECKPNTPTCETGKYCLQFNDKFFCEPCPERDTIRHEFRDRDFVVEQARDPFESFVVIQPGRGGTTEEQHPPTVKCTRQEQFVATNYSFQDLKLVGIVAQGTQRKVLMLDKTNLGHIIRRGDCVGKEKAVVKDIGTGYITFQVEADPTSRRSSEEHSFQLHPTQLSVEPVNEQAPAPAPTVPPPATPATPAKTPRGT